jgi:hypothetical protein
MLSNEMPSSVYGCGMRYYGARDFRKDGSYVTTNFFCILFFPLFPIHTVRVIPDPKNTEWAIEGTNHYLVLEKRWPNPLQVGAVYLCELAVLALMVLYFERIEPFLREHVPWLTSRWVVYIPFFLTLMPPLIVAHFLRKRARNRAFAEDRYSPAPIR